MKMRQEILNQIVKTLNETGDKLGYIKNVRYAFSNGQELSDSYLEENRIDFVADEDFFDQVIEYGKETGLYKTEIKESVLWVQ